MVCNGCRDMHVTHHHHVWLHHQQAVATTASLAGQYSSRVTVLFVDEEGKELDASSRIEQIKGYVYIKVPCGNDAHPHPHHLAYPQSAIPRGL